MGFEGGGFSAVPEPITTEGEADLSEEDVAQVRERLSQPEQKNINDVSPAELDSLGITKTIGEQGEIVYDYGYSPDTGEKMKEMNLKVETTRKSINDPDVIKANIEREERNKADFAAGKGPTLPSYDE
jgi:hypothetical protein